MRVLQTIKQISTDKLTLTLMGFAGDDINIRPTKAEYVLVDNYITKNKSVMIPFKDLQELLSGYNMENNNEQ